MGKFLNVVDMIKIVVILHFLLTTFCTQAQKEKGLGDLHFQLSVDALNVATGDQLDTFDIIFSSRLGNVWFTNQGTETRLIVLDSSALYSVKVIAKDLTIAEYSWDFNVEEGNYQIVHAMLYPEGSGMKQRKRALKKYRRNQKKQSVKKTCNGLHWFHEVYI